MQPDYSKSPQSGPSTDGVAVETVVTSEVDDFATAVAGLIVDYTRTSRGDGPLAATSVATSEVAITTGSMGFSTISRAVVPADAYIFATIHATPPGASWNGTEFRAGDTVVAPPGCNLVGAELEGLIMTLWVAPAGPIHGVAADLGLAKAPSASGVETATERSCSADLNRITHDILRRPELLNSPSHRTTLLEELARSTHRAQRTTATSRRSLSRTIVDRCLDHAAATGDRTPPLAVLCRAASASESRVRAAFIDITGLPPTLYFQRHLLNEARLRLVEAEPSDETVTRIAGDLGITQFGRFAGRYRQLFGETPRATLHQATRPSSRHRRPSRHP